VLDLAVRTSLLLLLVAGASGQSQADEVEFNRDIRPILAEHCFACHGPDEEARQADLRLDIREEAIFSEAFVPGNAGNSELVRRIMAARVPDGHDAGEVSQMPPEDFPKQLSDGQRETLKTWIAEGARYQQHWSWVPLVPVENPVVKDQGWARGAIDSFVLAGLDKAGLQPAPEADIGKLVRRVSLDLTGLPPSPEELQAVLDDPNPDRYERYVDRLLASPRWGEHRGRYWLDYARYADTHGIHFDNYREIWSYRDWVISAFNANMPFDQFSVEQIAGDLLPNPSLDQLIATGFNRCNTTTNEGGAINEEYQVLYTRDRVETVSVVWLGLTSGCAVCHDHKYDPLSQKDFYELAAFFNNTTQAAMDGNIKDTPPIIPVPMEAERARFAVLESELENARGEMDAYAAGAQGKLDQWRADPTQLEKLLWQVDPILKDQLTHLPLDGNEKRDLSIVDQGRLFRIPVPGENKWENGWTGESAWVVSKDNLPAFRSIGDFEQDQPYSVMLWVKPGSANQGGALVSRMENQAPYRGWDLWLQDGKIAAHLIHEWPKNAIKVGAVDRLPAGKWSHVTVTWDGSKKVQGMKLFVNGQEVKTAVEADTLDGTTRTDVPFRLGTRHNGGDTAGAAMTDLRIFGRSLSGEEVSGFSMHDRAVWLLSRPDDQLSDEDRKSLPDMWMSMFDENWRVMRSRFQALQDERTQIAQRGTVAHIMQESPEAPTAFVLFRGAYDQRRDQVSPDTPGFLPAMNPDLPRNRMGFAQWIVDPENPLTARVTVNRFWQEVFGQGLVGSSGDFGTTGQMPTNPELLDFLAVEFRDHGWDVKRLFRNIVTSATYRQSVVVTDEKLERDRDNHLYSRGPRFRMDAEVVRDFALAASGLLSDKIGGPSVRPYQPEGVWEAVAMPESNTRNYKPDTGDSLYRRSMYTIWKRAAPPASMDILNAPSREVCTVQRERTNTPLQALVTLNDPQFVEAARILAQQSLERRDRQELDESKVFLFLGRTLLSRDFDPAELAILDGSLKELRTSFAGDVESAKMLLEVGERPAGYGADDPAELAAWTMLINQLMNLDEVLNK